MSINKFITIKDSIQDFFEDTGVDATSQRPTLMRWATRAEKDIDSPFGWSKFHKKLKIKGCTAKLPAGCMRVQYVVIGDYECECGDLMKGFYSYLLIGSQSGSTIVSDNAFIIVDNQSGGNFVFGPGNIKWEVQDNTLVFPSNSMDGQTITIQALGLAEDCDGWLLVNENHIEAITAYLKYRFAQRSRFSPQKMDLADVKLFKDEWGQRCSSARADDNLLSETDRRDIVAMLHDPYVGWGMQVGMYNPNDDIYYGN